MEMSLERARPRRPGALFDEAPFMVFWETTRACDLICHHCRACAVPQRDPRELSTAEGIALLEEIAAMGTTLVVLTGGDPAKREDLVTLVRHGTEVGLRMALTPSATPLVTPGLLEQLKEAGLVRLAISVDASTAAAHDAMRGVEGAFHRSLMLLRHARRIGLGTQINTSVDRYDPAELDALEVLATDLDIELFSVFVIVPTGRAAEAVGIAPDDMERLLEHLAQMTERASFDVKTTAAPHFRRVLLQRKHKKGDVKGIQDGIGRAPRGVNDGQGIVFVSHVGEISPSGFMPIGCGNVRLEGLTRVYRTNPLFVALRDPDLLEGKCGCCEYRKICGGSRARAYALAKNPLASDPACAYQPRRTADDDDA